MENEPNLRQYVGIVIKHRWIVIATTVLAALTALASTYIDFSRPGTSLYEATAGVLIVHMRTQVTFDPRFKTVEDVSAVSYISQDAHRTALAEMVRNGQVATQVAEQLKEKWGVEGWEAARLMAMVNGKVVERRDEGVSQSATSISDLIEIQVRFADPEQAAWIANAWAEAYVEHVNALYGAEAESLVAVQDQVDDARQAYEQAEQALIDFAAENQIADLEQRIAEKNTLIDNLQTGRQAVYLEAVRNEQLTLSQYYATARQLRQLLENARALRQQIQQGGTSAATANELTLIILKAEAFAAAGELPANLQLQIDLGGSEASDATSQLAELDALIEVLEMRLADLERDIQEQSALLSSGEYYTEEDSTAFNETIGDLQEEVRQLQAQLAQEQAREKELTEARDLAWDTYSTLEVKAAELRIAAALPDVEVRFASPALAPEMGADGALAGSVPSHLSRNVGLAAVVGLILGTGVAFFLHYYDSAYDSSAAIGALFKRRREEK
jgi:uncharacterized protein involved in exopolysaccharide biosynthesis